MERLDPRAVKRISGPAWDGIRSQFDQINGILLSVAEDIRGNLTTIYVKYAGTTTGDRPYAVVWTKKSTELVVGFALPDSIVCPLLCPAPTGYKYAGLTKYLIVRPGDTVPPEIHGWARQAYENARQQ